MNVLIIDTVDNKKNIVGLKFNNKKFFLTEDVTSSKTQAILPMIDKILEKHKVKKTEISAIEVNIGPGSYTGLRVGLAVANALSYVLKVPVNGKIGKIILPIYK